MQLYPKTLQHGIHHPPATLFHFFIPPNSYQSFSKFPVPPLKLTYYNQFFSLTRSQSWKDLHPDWEYKFWSDGDNDNFVATHFGWLQDTYSKLPDVINKADMVRYVLVLIEISNQIRDIMKEFFPKTKKTTKTNLSALFSFSFLLSTYRYLYMLKEGGVYADLDTWLMRKLDTLTEGFTNCVGQKAILAMMSNDIYFEHNIPNAWMASSPGHPFWLFLVRVIQERYTEILLKQAQGDTTASIGVERLTGPIVLKEAYETWKCTFGDDRAKVEVIDPGYVFVSNWNNKEEADYFIKMCNGSKITTQRQQQRCSKAFPNAHVLTFWTHTWTDPWFEQHSDDVNGEEQDGEQTGESGKKGNDKDYSYEDEGDYH
jgi:inositol phosphorylceramide mannosyltransferase catalytic subunit